MLIDIEGCGWSVYTRVSKAMQKGIGVRGQRLFYKGGLYRQVCGISLHECSVFSSGLSGRPWGIGRHSETGRGDRDSSEEAKRRTGLDSAWCEGVGVAYLPGVDAAGPWRIGKKKS